MIASLYHPASRFNAKPVPPELLPDLFPDLLPELCPARLMAATIELEF
jgi:hypothetical protein